MIKNCILLTCNLPYLPYALFVAWQLQHTVSKNFDIVIASDDEAVGESLPNGIKFLYLKDVKIWKSIKQSSRLKYFTYLRLPAIEILTSKYERILYLDTDVFICNRMIGKIFEANIDKFAIGAVRDVQQRDNLLRYVDDFKYNNLGQAPYFNAGLLLINSPLWNKYGVYDLLKELALSNPNATRTDDQTLLNLALYRKWGELSPTWNWIESPKTNLAASYYDAHIVHVAGATKHWNDGSTRMSQRFRREFEVFIDTHPEFEKLRPEKPKLSEVSNGFWRALLLNLRWLNLSKNALNRFQHELTVLPTDDQSGR